MEDLIREIRLLYCVMSRGNGDVGKINFCLNCQIKVRIFKAELIPEAATLMAALTWDTIC